MKKQKGYKYVFQVKTEYTSDFNEMKQQRSDLFHASKDLKRRGINASYNDGFLTIATNTMKEMDKAFSYLVSIQIYSSKKDALSDMKWQGNY